MHYRVNKYVDLCMLLAHLKLHWSVVETVTLSLCVPWASISNIPRVPNQNGVSQAWYIAEIHHSGREPSNFVFLGCITCKQPPKKTSRVEPQRHLYMLPHIDRSCRINLPFHKVTINCHQTNWSQHWFQDVWHLTGKTTECHLLTLIFLVSVVTILNSKTNSCVDWTENGSILFWNWFVDGISCSRQRMKSRLSLTSGFV